MSVSLNTIRKTERLSRFKAGERGMLHTETVRIELPRLVPSNRDRNGAGDYPLKSLKAHQRQYEKRKAAGICTSTGCREKPDPGHTHCQWHLQEMSERNRKQYQRRMRKGLCVYCGMRPGFWGLRCVICRQKFTKHPLPYGARRALRLYREAEDKREHEQIEVEARHAVRKLLASGDITGKRANAWRLYAGVDDGKWRTYKEVGERMKISKERVRQLLRPSKLTLARILGSGVPWGSVQRISHLIQIDRRSLRAKLFRCCDKPPGIIKKRESRLYDDLPVVNLVGVPVHHCEIEITPIPRQQKLDRELARRVLLKPASLAGRDLQFLRRASRLTIEALSERLGVSSSTLSSWEASAALRHNKDLAARVVIASILDPIKGPRLIHKILESILARWSDAKGE